MVERDLSPDAGGNTEQADDGRDPVNGRLPEPLDAAHYGQGRDFEINTPGMPASQPAGMGPVVSSPPAPPAVEPDAEPEAGEDEADGPPPAAPTGLATLPRAGS